MTKKRYDKTTDPSRSKTASAGARSGRTKRAAPRTAPSGAHFEALQPDSEEHPVDVIVDRIPLIAALGRELVRMAERIKGQVKDRRAFVAYEDLRLHLRTEREVAYYNIGHEHGKLVGRTESLSANTARDPLAKDLSRHVHAAVMTSRLPARRVPVVLLELARAYLLGDEHAVAAGRRR